MKPSIRSLPVKKRGRPLLLGEELDTEVKRYIRAVREGGGVINTAITMAAATAIVRKADRNLLAENGRSITITSNWAKSLLYRMNFVKRRGSSTAKMTVMNFEAVKEQFVLDVNAVVEMEDILPEFVFNWDQTGISVVPGSSWTMEVKGSSGDCRHQRQTPNYGSFLWCNDWRVSTSTADLPRQNVSLSPSLQFSG